MRGGGRRTGAGSGLGYDRGMSRPNTLGALLDSGWRPRSVHDELRANLVGRLRSGEPVFPGIVGFDETVVPQLQNAILSGHSVLLLGLRGQAKTRLARSLVALLDEWVPAIEGSPLNEDPTAPVTVPSIERARREGRDLAIRWLHRSERYHEKLATPDVTVADLVGDVDPIKAATRRLTFADPEVIHFGLLPRSNRGIFAVNELPDLAARIQVALLNVLEEGDVQIRGFPIRMPLDVFMIFTANPEDYTNRGAIITPLRDRIASQILTHYPRTLAEAQEITDQEARTSRSGVAVHIPMPIREAIELVAFQARRSEFVDQASGVSARLSIALLENVVSNAERRAHLAGASNATARPSDLFTAVPAISGKVELVYDGEKEGLAAVSRMLVGKALAEAFERHFPGAYDDEDVGDAAPKKASVYDAVLSWFRRGQDLALDDRAPDDEHLGRLQSVDGLATFVKKHAAPRDDAELASLMELVLEGLHQGSLLSRDDDEDGGRVYGDMLAQMAKSLGR